MARAARVATADPWRAAVTMKQGKAAGSRHDPTRWTDGDPMLPNVQQRTIEPLITRSVAKGTLINTDEYDIHARLPAWRHQRKTVCHGQEAYAR